MSEYLEFTVCLKDEQDKDNFMQQMASDVQILNSVIPVRSCEVKEEEIPLKRYVKYKLSIEEADALEKIQELARFIPHYLMRKENCWVFVLNLPLLKD